MAWHWKPAIGSVNVQKASLKFTELNTWAWLFLKQSLAIVQRNHVLKSPQFSWILHLNTHLCDSVKRACVWIHVINERWVYHSSRSESRRGATKGFSDIFPNGAKTRCNQEEKENKAHGDAGQIPTAWIRLDKITWPSVMTLKYEKMRCLKTIYYMLFHSSQKKKKKPQLSFSPPPPQKKRANSEDVNST